MKVVYRYKCHACQEACDPGEYFGFCEYKCPIDIDPEDLVCPIANETCEWQKAETE